MGRRRRREEATTNNEWATREGGKSNEVGEGKGGWGAKKGPLLMVFALILSRGKTRMLYSEVHISPQSF